MPLVSLESVTFRFQVLHFTTDVFYSRLCTQELLDPQHFKLFELPPTYKYINVKPHSHCADVATVHPDAVQTVYRDAPGHIS